MNHLRPASADDVVVTWEDQQHINKFGRYHTRLIDLKDEISLKKTEIESVVDSVSEIENLLDDDCCKVKIGEIFFEVSNEEAEEFAKDLTTKLTNELKELEQTQVQLQNDVDELKEKLYAKFGSSIALDA